MSDSDSWEFSLITDQLFWTVGLLSISSMEWDNLLQGWDSLRSSMQNPSSVFPLFHCFSIWQYSYFLFRSEKVPFSTPKPRWLWNVFVCDCWNIQWMVKKVSSPPSGVLPSSGVYHVANKREEPVTVCNSRVPWKRQSASIDTKVGLYSLSP